jgi:hypothetical protein
MKLGVKQVKKSESFLLKISEIAVSSSEIQARRRSHFTDADIDELAASIKANGLIQPITVRPRPVAQRYQSPIRSSAASAGTWPAKRPGSIRST